jgi:hypothetical protein
MQLHLVPAPKPIGTLPAISSLNLSQDLLAITCCVTNIVVGTHAVALPSVLRSKSSLGQQIRSIKGRNIQESAWRSGLNRKRYTNFAWLQSMPRAMWWARM